MSLCKVENDGHVTFRLINFFSPFFHNYHKSTSKFYIYIIKSRWKAVQSTCLDIYHCCVTLFDKLTYIYREIYLGRIGGNE